MTDDGRDWLYRHSVTANDGSFDSCPKVGGNSFTVNFSQAGTYKYHCRIHPVMRGDVIVG
jgi:plastocyanin